ncbi:MAG: diaminopimelate decarboxylase [Alphaproteobacteria bacterium]|nr:diaminopimelate decarboxylase [Alphaproteobacteria bacterium]MBP7759672.1 diaminopimelate decarboxylase [Alphaproteobacteria bacterium]MBP7763022.1 diaminopimelate decarboxylase [Alphaproteobacteria bacterium]MBP7904419.1 diaminopimelate decarboxylase [Alphaproteobacteria bacterium]
MTAFHDKKGILHVEDIPLPEIARQVGTPCYVYSAASIRSQYGALKSALEKVFPPERMPVLCYACKANSNIAILRVLQQLGSGLEIVSEGELFRGIEAGFRGDRIISTSFGKNEQEIRACLEADIHQFIIESWVELEQVNHYAAQAAKETAVLFRLNPDISGGGHSKISTGRKEHKFGNTENKIIEMYRRAAGMKYVRPVGISVHIGSQVTTLDSFRPAYEAVASLVKRLRAEKLTVERLDIGGGFPIAYTKNDNLLDLNAFAEWIAEIILPLNTEIQLEPGRYMVGNAGVLLTETLYVKETEDRRFLVLDAAMNDLIRPALYEAHHGIRPVLSRSDRKILPYDVVGPICESGDIFAKQRDIPEVRRGELVVIESAGAYGFSMASNYNSRPLPAEVLVDGSNMAVIRKRQTLHDLTRGETIPEWLR